MKHILISAAILGTLTACNSEKSWEVKGQIDNSSDSKMLVQASENGRWYTLDTIEIKSDGTFAYKHTPSGYPDIYRLTLDGKSIYFPIDSVESVTVNSDAKTFDSEYTLSGSSAAEMLMNVDRLIMSKAKSGETKSDSLLKRELGGMIIGDPAGIVSYYIINRQLNGKRLFDPSNKSDNRIIGAVANAFNEKRPSDPRTGYLTTIYLSNKSKGAPTDTIVATTMSYFDLDLSDNKGVEHKLSEVVNGNKVVILNFTSYQSDGSTALNVLLADTYRKYHNQGVEIYQVSMDNDEFQWKQSAKNLPWVTVYNPPTQGFTLANKYNILGLPTTYLFSDGELVERVEDLTKLDSQVARYL